MSDKNTKKRKFGLIIYFILFLFLWFISVGPAYQFVITFDLDVLINNPQVIIADIYTFIGFFYLMD